MREINIVWLKRDLRLADHLPLARAIKAGLPFIVLYCFEDLIAAHDDFDFRHWRFVHESLEELSRKLPLTVVAGDVTKVFSQLSREFRIHNVFSHQETGVEVTYKRDLELRRFFQKRSIRWQEDLQDGVWRGLKNRQSWDARWEASMKAPLIPSPTEAGLSLSLRLPELEAQFPVSEELKQLLQRPDPDMAHGGESRGQAQLVLFLKDKLEDYIRHIGLPKASRYSTSRLSPYLAYGNLSLRQIYHACQELRPQLPQKLSLDQFVSRLKWRSHFIQRFEMESTIEHRNLHSSFNGLNWRPRKDYLEAWKEGRTGYPLIDAGMRCVKVTGHLNFRMRATVVSFLTHHLWQPWAAGASHLARCFLDYEPGIHYCQMQMQAGVMGTNTIRIYNPVKQSWEKDPEAVFIKEWVPELAHLPLAFIHEPWTMTSMDQAMWNVELGRDYPLPLINHEETAARAREKLWGTKNLPLAEAQMVEIRRKHCR